jgi:hypothetical protein
LLRALELNGFKASGGELRRALPVDVGLPMAQSEVDRLLEKHRFATAKGHLKEALDAHGRGSWAAANSQIRTFLDALLDEIAVKLDPTAATAGSGQPRRTKLAAQGFLSRELNEWDDNGLGFMNGLAKRLHPKAHTQVCRMMRTAPFGCTSADGAVAADSFRYMGEGMNQIVPISSPALPGSHRSR